MQYIKKALIVVFLLIGMLASAQAYRFETSGVSMSVKNAKGVWTPYTKFQDARIVVTLDPGKDRITVYSEVIQLYTILAYEDENTSPNDGIDAFDCVNNDGEKCIIMIKSIKGTDDKQLYIQEDSRVLVYNMKLVK